MDGLPMKTDFKTAKEFQDFRKTAHRKKQLKALVEYLDDVEVAARDLVKKIYADKGEFTFDDFKENWMAKPNLAQDDVIAALKSYSDQLYQEGRISTSRVYKNSMKSLKRFTGKDKLSFKEITPNWLREYENWMTEEIENSITTVAMYLRSVKKVFNDEIASGKLPQNLYPFGRRGYKMPESNNVKKAITKEQVISIIEYKTRTTSMEYYRDLWVFSYLANGINPKDILHLKYKTINDDEIVFLRAKSRFSRPKEIRISLHPKIMEIIDKWGNAEKSPDNYVFPEITKGMTPVEAFNRQEAVVKSMNRYMLLIEGALKIEKHITTYTARHSMATVLKRTGASVDQIQEFVGHSTPQQTQRYLDSFDLETKKEMSRKLF